MATNINLLPKREKKNRAPFITFSALFIVTLLLIGLFIFWYWNLQHEAELLDNRLQQEQRTNAVLESEMEGDSEYQDSVRLEEITAGLQQSIQPVTPLMDELFLTLPNSGTINSVQYDLNQMTFTATTNTSEQAVVFYQELAESDLFADVMIHTITFDEENDEYTTNYTILLTSESGEVGS
ncbi:hypothetical protein CEY16_14155 [Halalkalibacillus sediminis]|uniref:Fimbrial assembly protein n=1 Tax=Halalkalibacillus sediminis TaxID=2018042 RepID=A0A2I0QRH7_9BACI|nr:PilN domain-containing protein [Halalkalibacillus sediminis]PKR76945.1 hypothetical protein CEY16_14155 [Halalkalibacillus sediminis]